MPSSLVTLVKINVSNTGSGAITLGSAAEGYRGREVLTNGTVYSYSIQQGSAWEFGRGTYLSESAQLVRSVIDSSDGGAAISLRPNAQVSLTAIAEDLMPQTQLTVGIQADREAAEAAKDLAETAAGTATTKAGEAASSAASSQEWAEGTEPGGPGTKSAKGWADRAEAAAENSIASIDGNRLSNAVALISQARSFDANSLTIPSRDGRAGTMLDLNPATPAYMLGAFNGPSGSALKCVRASSGVAIGGGASQTFTVDTPRIIGGKIFRDVGGTNIVPDPADFSVAGWTKTNLDTPTLMTGPGGANGAYRMLETSATGNHRLIRSITGLTAFSQVTVCFLVKPVGRDFVEYGFFNANTAKNTTARVNLTTGAFVSGYPAQSGGGQTAVNGGTHAYGDGWWLLWITTTYSPNETGFRPYVGTMSNGTTTSFAGDTSKGLEVAGIWAVAGVGLPVSFLTGTRAAETLTTPLARGPYIEQASDGTVTSLSAFLLSTSGYRALAFPSNAPWVARYQLYTADAYDAFDRADTSLGSLGTASDGGAYTLFNGYVSSYPQPTATTGQVVGGWVRNAPASGSPGALYAVRNLGGDVKFASMRFRFGPAVSGGGTLSNMALALLTSSDIGRLVEVMPVHIVISRSGTSIQKRLISGEFVTIGFIGTRLSNNNSEHVVSFAIHGTAMRVTLNNQSVIVNDAVLANAGWNICWEIISTSNNTTDNAQFKDAFATRALVGDVPTFVAAAPVVTDPAFVSPSSPPTYTSGCTLSVLPQPALVNSNSGPVTITAYQWYRNGMLISGATAATHVTTAGTDAGATFYCAITYTNNTGSTVGNSIITPALA